MINGKRKVFVGLSGGVDSSVTAALLKDQGYDVTGVFIKVWQPDFIECTWKEDRLDAMRVASVLDIPFITLDLEKEYKEGVIDYMIDEYKNGKTPNPDVFCNKEVKFGAFLNWIKKKDKDAYVATGHYAQIENGSLKVSKDDNKDQSYFLWTLNAEQIKSIIFPVGGMTKDQVRDMAKKYNLPTQNKKDSQGLCFVGSIELKDLLKTYIKEKRGDVLNENGEIIGYHDGVMFFTVGERHGFTITKKGIEDNPYFVTEKDLEKNTLTVSHNRPKELQGNTIKIKNINFTKEIKEGSIYSGRARYRAPLSKLKAVSEKEWEVVDGEILKTSGQSLVIYDGDICLGGGVIE